jgi:hypothetical protein
MYCTEFTQGLLRGSESRNQDESHRITYVARALRAMRGTMEGQLPTANAAMRRKLAVEESRPSTA